jgi:general stress protein YciG
MQRITGRGRGFASMNPEKKREIASKGGKAAHLQGTAHKWTSEEARIAGQKCGKVKGKGSHFVLSLTLQYNRGGWNDH